MSQVYNLLIMLGLKKPHPSKIVASSNSNVGADTDVLGDRAEPLSILSLPYMLVVNLCFFPSENILL